MEHEAARVGDHELRVVVLSRELEQPWSVAFLPDGAMLITERPGRLRVFRDGRLDLTPVPGVPEVRTGGARGLQGLMDVVLHPRFAENQFVYLTYHKPTPDGGGATTLARGRGGTAPGSPEVQASVDTQNRPLIDTSKPAIF